MPKVADFTQATSIDGTDILYTVKSPYTSGFDRYITLDDAGLSPGSNYREEALAASTSVTDTTITIDNELPIRVGDWVCVDAYTVEAEIRKVTFVSTTTLTLHSQLNFAHAADDTVLKLPSATWDVRLFGAAVDGATRDTVAVNNARTDATAQGGNVGIYFPPGVTMVDRYTENGGTYRGCIDVDDASDLHFFGAGADVSFVKLIDNTTGVGLHVFLCDDATNLSFCDLTIDGNHQNLTLSNEQMHGIETNGGNFFSVTKCNFYNLRGDGIRFFGNEVDPADFKRYYYIEGCRFINARRSGIGVQRQYNFVWILNNYFNEITDQAIDFEPSGDGSPSYFIIDNNVFERDPPAGYTRGRIAVTLSGIGSVDRHMYSRFTNNTVYGGTVQGLSIEGLIISNNHIEDNGDDTGTEALVYLFRNVRNTIVSNNTLVVADSASVHTAMNFAVNSSQSPENISVINNMIQQNCPNGHGIKMLGTISGMITGNTIERTVSGGSLYGVDVETGAAVDDVEIIINGNRVTGAWARGIRVAETTAVFKALSIKDNHIYGAATLGVSLQSGPFAIYPQISGNLTDAPTPLSITSTEILIVGGSHGSQANYSGEGAPTFSAAVGSMYQRRDGAAGSALYVNTDGGTTWAAAA